MPEGNPTPREKEETEDVGQPEKGKEFIKKERKSIGSVSGQAKGRNQLSSRRSEIRPQGTEKNHGMRTSQGVGVDPSSRRNGNQIGIQADKLA